MGISVSYSQQQYSSIIIVVTQSSVFHQSDQNKDINASFPFEKSSRVLEQRATDKGISTRCSRSRSYSTPVLRRRKPWTLLLSIPAVIHRPAYPPMDHSSSHTRGHFSSYEMLYPSKSSDHGLSHLPPMRLSTSHSRMIQPISSLYPELQLQHRYTQCTIAVNRVSQW